MITKEYIIQQKNNRNAITLVSLVLTIIILMILITITTILIFNNQFLDLTKYTKTATITEQLREEKEHYLDGKKLSNGLDAEDITPPSATEFEQKVGGTFEFKNDILYYNNQKTNITKAQYDDWFKYQPPPPPTQPTIPSDLKVGDTIIYDPTKDVTDASKLTYISPKDQNGYGEQTITATSNHNEWVVISTSGGQVKMMSKEPIDGIEGGIDGNGNTHGFTLKGGKGYLYAEEELHKACSVFGHGKGAGKISTKYTVGNPYIGEAEERTLSGSGARSLILSDIVSVIKGEGQDFTDEEKKSFNSSYKTKVSSEVYYPTKVSTKENGSSDDKKSFTHDYYSISKDEYTNYAKSETKTARDALVNSIFKDKYYWYGSRCVSIILSDAYFSVSIVSSSGVYARRLFLRRCRFSQCEFLGAGPKTCSIFRRKYDRKTSSRSMEDKRLK